MSEIIYKYPLKMEIQKPQFVEMPAGAIVLSVASQYGTPELWAQVNNAPKNKTIKRKFWLVATGKPLPKGMGRHYIATIQLNEGSFHTLHLFTDREEYPI